MLKAVRESSHGVLWKRLPSAVYHWWFPTDNEKHAKFGFLYDIRVLDCSGQRLLLVRLLNSAEILATIRIQNYASRLSVTISCGSGIRNDINLMNFSSFFETCASLNGHVSTLCTRYQAVASNIFTGWQMKSTHAFEYSWSPYQYPKQNEGKAPCSLKTMFWKGQR